MESATPFIGELQETKPGDKEGVLRELAGRTPVFTDAIAAMRQAGIRDRNGRSIEQDTNGVVNIKERSFRIMSEHGVTVAMAADGLSDVLGFEPKDRELLVSAALFHDVTKKTEVVLNGFRTLVQKDRVTDEAKEVLQETLESVDALDGQELDSHIQKISQPSTKEYLDYFRREIDEPFLSNALSKTSLSSGEQKNVSDIAMSDTLTSMRRLGVVLQSLDLDGATQKGLEKFWEIHNKINQSLGHDAKDISLDDPATLLGPIHLYCDDISRGNEITTLDKRMDALIDGAQYTEMDQWAESISGGLSYFNVERVLGHATEHVIKNIGVKNGAIPPDTQPVDIPRIIMHNLQERVGRR